jgi:hypothetical protein
MIPSETRFGTWKWFMKIILKPTNARMKTRLYLM